MARRSPPPSRRERLGVLLDSPAGRVLARVTVAAVVFLLAGIVMRQARAYTYGLEDFRIGKEQVEITDLPEWADARIHYAMQPRLFPNLSVSIYDPQAEALVRAHVEKHPFVREVHAVRVLYPNRAEVQADLRVPVAQVAVWVDAPGRKQVRRWRLLSDDGCLLPRESYRAYLDRLPYHLPVATGITEPAPHDPCEVWEDGSGRVQEAVAAARLAERIFRDTTGSISVVRVDVSRFNLSPKDRIRGEVRLVISCPPARAGGKRVQRTIEWGRTEQSMDRAVREDGYARKFSRLKALLSRPDAPGFLDVRMDLPAPRARTHP